ncbi:hypothetical protein Tco_1210967 [Tanacetum coccineum]
MIVKSGRHGYERELYGQNLNYNHISFFSHQSPPCHYIPEQVWNHMKIYAGTPKMAASLNAIIDHIIPMSKKKTIRSVIVKLVFAASTYFIWQERNYWLFKNQKRSPNQIASRSRFILNFSHVEDSSLSMVVYGLRLECQIRAVLFFLSLGFFPLGFSWEGFLRRQYQLAYYSPNEQLSDSFGDFCSIRWFFPIGVIVDVFI